MQYTISNSELEKFSIPHIMLLMKDSPAGTAEYIIGLKLYEGVELTEKNISAAFNQLLKAANKGHADACFMVSTMYLRGEGTPQNTLKYFEFLEKAAQLGSPHAQYNYGVMLLGQILGKGRFHEGFEWLKKAANQESGAALAGLGIMAREGIDDFGNKIEPDYEKAFELFKQAAEKKSYAGMFSLGCIDI